METADGHSRPCNPPPSIRLSNRSQQQCKQNDERSKAGRDEIGTVILKAEKGRIK
jgi:hypothetical protein